MAAAVRRNRVGISPKHKPVSFIFVGSTGVGKTELVKRLAEDLFNTPDALIRLDMSEFMEKHSVSRIVGSPPGYVGYDEAGQLTEKIRRKPYAVVLFDEIEKAHPDVLNVLLQILDDGEITDAHGRKVNFENTVIVMTSNAGSERKEGTVGFGRSVNEQNRERAMKALQQFLRPEFINRVDEVVCFNQLTEENFRAIARIMLDELAGSLGEKGITFRYDDALLGWLTDKSYSAAYGARNLRRTIQKELEDPMATAIIDSYEHPVSQVYARVENEQDQAGYPVKNTHHRSGEGRGAQCCFVRTLTPAAPTVSGAPRSTSGRWPAPSRGWFLWSTTAAASSMTRSSVSRPVPHLWIPRD